MQNSKHFVSVERNSRLFCSDAFAEGSLRYLKVPYFLHIVCLVKRGLSTTELDRLRNYQEHRGLYRKSSRRQASLNGVT